MAENETVDTEVVDTKTNEQANVETAETQTEESAIIAKLRADLLKAKAATDKATKEAAESKRALRAKQSAEEIAAEAEKERQEAIEKELNDLRKEKAVAQISKRAFTFLQDEEISTTLAEALYGAADSDLCIDTISKAWAAREKALKLEYGKIPAPGVGDTNGSTLTKAEILNIKDAAARQKAIAENIHLFR